MKRIVILIICLVACLYTSMVHASMIGSVVRISDQDINALMKNPTLIHSFLGFEENDRAMTGGLFSHRQDGDEVDIDKAWHVIHYLLTGSVDEEDTPLSFLVSGGVPVGDENIGYGPARAFTSQELSKILDALKAIDREVLYARYKPEEIAKKEIYSNDWGQDRDEGFNDIYEYFQQLRSFLEDAQDKKQGILVLIT